MSFAQKVVSQFMLPEVPEMPSSLALVRSGTAAILVMAAFVFVGTGLALAVAALRIYPVGLPPRPWSVGAWGT